MKTKNHEILKKALEGIDHPTTRVIVFLGFLGKLLEEKGLKLPIVVGGAAKDALGWAKTLITIGEKNGIPFDRALLENLAIKADVADKLEVICPKHNLPFHCPSSRPSRLK